MYRTLVKTAGLDHALWLKYRKQGIGGSDAGAICGLNPYVSPISVFLDKISDEREDRDNESMRQGRDLEEYVAQRFMEETGKKVRRCNRMLQSKKHPFMIADVDRMIVGENAGLECKTASPYSSDKWEDGKIPEHYQLQCHHYMAVTGADAWYIAVIIYGREFKYARIERDEEIIRHLISIEREFWYRNVKTCTMPSPDGSKIADEVIRNYFRESDQEKKVALQEFDGQLKRRDELTAMIDRLEKERRQIDQEIKLAMADAEVGLGSSHLVSWKSYTTSRLDTERLKKEKPDIYRDYSKETQARRFTVNAA